MQKISSHCYLQISVCFHGKIWLENGSLVLEIVGDNRVFKLKFVIVISSHPKVGSKAYIANKKFFLDMNSSLIL
jgi:hypothetical protein